MLQVFLKKRAARKALKLLNHWFQGEVCSLKTKQSSKGCTAASWALQPPLPWIGLQITAIEAAEGPGARPLFESGSEPTSC